MDDLPVLTFEQMKEHFWAEYLRATPAALVRQAFAARYGTPPRVVGLGYGGSFIVAGPVGDAPTLPSPVGEGN